MTNGKHKCVCLGVDHAACLACWLRGDDGLRKRNDVERKEGRRRQSVAMCQATVDRCVGFSYWYLCLYYDSSWSCKCPEYSHVDTKTYECERDSLILQCVEIPLLSTRSIPTVLLMINKADNNKQ